MLRSTRIQILLCVLCVVVAGFAATDYVVHAQQEAATAEVFDRELQRAHIEKLQETYVAQVGEYRSVADDFSRAHEEYKSLQTLRSFDASLEALRVVYAARDAVLATYIELLEAELLDATGVPLELKNPTLQELAAVRTRIIAHEELVQSSFDKEMLQTRSNEFVSIGVDMQSSAYKTQSLLVLGDAQAILDNATALREAIEAKHQDGASVSALQASKRDRAYAEVDEQLQDVQALIQKIFDEILAVQEKDNVYGSADYRRSVRDVEEARTLLSQGITFLDELLTL